VIDWRLASTVAQGVAAATPAPEWHAFESVGDPVAESQALVSAYTGLTSREPLPVPEAIQRAGWVEANQRSIRGVLDPVAEQVGGNLGGPLRGALNAGAGALLAVEVGVLSGYLAQRVLGQYEFPVLDPQAPARLLFVGPNLADAAEKLQADPSDLLRWVALHETTHALQFGGVPWLRGHIADAVRELLSTAGLNARSALRMPDPSDIGALIDAMRSGGLPALVVRPEQRPTLERMQAFMAVVEGYAEHVMDVVGVTLLPTLPELRKALDQRRRDRTGLLKLLERLIGLDMKLRQYEQGKAFCDGVVARAGIAGLNQVWTGPESMPTLSELDDPRGWLARVEPRRLDAGGPQPRIEPPPAS
jgi:coenzyme F420 biosynthesis associated uncharacterized protein